MIMKQKYIFILLAVLSAVFACTRIDEGQLGTEEPAQEKVKMTFTAVIDETDNTKTLLEGAVGDGFRNVLWQPGDAIGISSDIEHMMLGSVEKFVANTEIAALSTEFDGFISMSSKYKAFYPYSETVRDSSNCFIFNLPSQQKYVANSFDPAAAPMVAVANYGETFKFRNLCGVLALQLIGEEAVKSIVFSGCDESGNLMKVSGEFEVNPHQETLSVVPLWKSSGSVTMNCEKPVQLNMVTPTAFHMVLPAGTYNTFTVMIVTEDASGNTNVMLKQATNPLTIKRSEVQPTAALMYVETVSVDLSKAGTANSYIVNGPGLYSFDASVIGNGIYGLIDGVNFHTDSPYINPVKAMMLWEDRVGVLGTVACDGERVTFVATGNEGNALIAVTDSNDEILWSWHIWVTDQPEAQVYNNTSNGNTYVMMDRNMGSVSAVVGESGGEVYYQWGRKDPLPVNEYGLLGDIRRRNTFGSIAESITQPASFPMYDGSYDWFYTANMQLLALTSLWSTDVKTIYDPCPAGWRAPVRDVWTGIRVMHDYDGSPAGVVLGFNDSDSFWYPDTPRLNYHPELEGGWTDDDTQLWTAEDGISEYITYNRDEQMSLFRNYALPVRCMKDDGYEAACAPMVKIKAIKDVAADGALVEARISAQGLTPVTECGIIWGTSSDLTLENGTSQVVIATSNEFSYKITGLDKTTRYYVRAYAKNENGVGYSETQSFITLWEGEAWDLSEEGTANCYIVPPICAEYSFNATVRGNSTESVGEIASAQVLWETELYQRRGESIYTYQMSVGDIISEAWYEDGKVHFMLPLEPKSGNASIAVKDPNGTILWSWHIWVVDYDPVDTQVKNGNGLVMMDRNLGATYVLPVRGPDYDPTVMVDDYGAYGLYYQWGRKDPLVLNALVAPDDAFLIYGNNYNSEENSIEYTYAYPTIFFDDVNWGGDTNLWQTEKTINDPCPLGWRVPNIEVWNYVYGDCPDGSYYRTYTEPTSYYPFGGVADWDYSYTDYRNSYGFYWSTTPGYIFKVWNCGASQTYELNSGNKASVRCMKDEKLPMTGGGKDYVVDDEYEW